MTDIPGHLYDEPEWVATGYSGGAAKPTRPTRWGTMRWRCFRDAHLDDPDNEMRDYYRRLVAYYVSEARRQARRARDAEAAYEDAYSDGYSQGGWDA